jgi:hypothetical protein
MRLFGMSYLAICKRLLVEDLVDSQDLQVNNFLYSACHELSIGTLEAHIHNKVCSSLQYTIAS